MYGLLNAITLQDSEHVPQRGGAVSVAHQGSPAHDLHGHRRSDPVQAQGPPGIRKIQVGRSKRFIVYYIGDEFHSLITSVSFFGCVVALF